MFSKQNIKEPTEGNSVVKTNNQIRKDEIPSIIAADLKIVGDLTCVGSVEVQGEIKGNVTCGNLTIHRTGTITGDVIADEVQVHGEVNGLVKGRNITLSETGRITGMIVYEALSVKDGAYIDGQCKSIDKLNKGSVEVLEMHEGTSERFLERERVPVEA